MNATKSMIKYVVFPLTEKLKGNNIRRYLDELNLSSHLSGNQIVDIERDKLKKLLLFSLDQIPAYNAYNNLKNAIEKDPFEAIKSFPVLTKKAFVKSADSYLNPAIPADRLITNRTGGSTGEPVKFSIDRKTVEYYEAARWRGLGWYGIGIGDRCAMIWGSPIELSQSESKKYQLKERWLKNRIIIPAYSINPASIKEYVDKLSSFKPEYIYGYATVLHLFAKLVNDAGLKPNLKLKAVVSTAETLHDYQRELIGKVFNCPVVNEYGARDGGIIAYECPCHNMHISAENAYIEVVDPKTFEPLPAGESGLILVTDLNNYTQPRIRYALGDMGVFAAEKCSCGVNLASFEKIEGRVDDTFVALDGTLIHGHYFNHIARNLDGFAQFQIIQSDRNNMTLKIVRSDKFSEKELEFFKSEIFKAMGNVNMETAFVNEIPLTPSGKIRYAIRAFEL